MARKQTRAPIVTNEGGRKTIEHGIYREQFWVLKSDSGEQEADPEAVMHELGDLDGPPRELLGQVKWLARQAAKKGRSGDEEMVETASQAIRLICGFLAINPSERDARIFLGAFWAGRLYEKLDVLPHQPDALTGKRHAQANRDRNAKKSRAAQRENEKRRKAVDAEMARQKRNHERLSLRRAMKAAAAKCECSFEAIKKAKPMNRWTARKKK